MNRKIFVFFAVVLVLGVIGFVIYQHFAGKQITYTIVPQSGTPVPSPSPNPRTNDSAGGFAPPIPGNTSFKSEHIAAIVASIILFFIFFGLVYRVRRRKNKKGQDDQTKVSDATNTRLTQTPLNVERPPNPLFRKIPDQFESHDPFVAQFLLTTLKKRDGLAMDTLLSKYYTTILNANLREFEKERRRSITKIFTKQSVNAPMKQDFKQYLKSMNDMPDEDLKKIVEIYQNRQEDSLSDKLLKPFSKPYFIPSKE